MAGSITISSSSEEILNSLRIATRLSSAASIARLALTYSLVKAGTQVPKSDDCTGADLRRPTFFGDDELILRSLISVIYGKSFENDDEFFSRHSIVKYHVDHGCFLLKQLFDECGQDEIAFWQRLAAEVKSVSPVIGTGTSSSLDIVVGKKKGSEEQVIVELSNTERHANSHLAIMGKPGVGKTQLLLKILADIRTQSQFRTNFIFFDYKGDVATNERFVEVTRARTYRIPEQQLPINPFLLNDYSEKAILISAEEKAKSFASIERQIGTVQKGTLREAIRSAYNQRSSQALRYPDFLELLSIVHEKYEQENKKDDSLIEILRQLTNFHLFWEHGSQERLIERIIEQTLIVDLHTLPVLKELVVYLVIERLYKEMAALPDSEIKDGHRELRTILVIDEAHNYLAQKNLFLQKIIREGRSKGVAVFFASQSPNDYTQKEFDFKELLEFCFIFGCDGVKPTAVQNILGCTKNTAKDIQFELANLKPSLVISKTLSDEEEVTKFKADAFYNTYQ
jgi:hypothetical protein